MRAVEEDTRDPSRNDQLVLADFITFVKRILLFPRSPEHTSVAHTTILWVLQEVKNVA